MSENIDFFVGEFGIDEVVLSGGEITERPDFFDLVASIGSKGLRFTTLISSGQGWSDPIARALSESIDRVVVSLTPRDAYDLRAPSSPYGQALSAVERLAGTEVIVQTNTVLLPGNLSLLGDVAEKVRQLGIESPIFTFPFPHGLVGESLRSFVPPWPVLVRALFDAVDRTEQRKPKIKNLPPCLLGAYERFCTKTTRRHFVQRGRQLERHGIIPPFIGLDYLQECTGCGSRDRCDGFWKEYLALESFPALAPRAA